MRFQTISWGRSRPETIAALKALPRGDEVGECSLVVVEEHAVGSSMMLRNAVNESVRVYCLLDSDYHTPDEIKRRLKDAAERGVDLHIWRRKEIENYLLVPEAIRRAIVKTKRRGVVPKIDQVCQKLDIFMSGMKQDIFGTLVQEFLCQDKAADVKPATGLAQERIEEAWKSFEGRLSIISGKELISQISKWTAAEFGTALGAKRIAQELTARELDAEVSQLMDAIEHGKSVPP